MIGYRFNIIIKGMFKPDHVAIGVADILNLPCMGKLVFPSLIHERAWMPVQFPICPDRLGYHKRTCQSMLRKHGVVQEKVYSIWKLDIHLSNRNQ